MNARLAKSPKGRVYSWVCTCGRAGYERANATRAAIDADQHAGEHGEAFGMERIALMRRDGRGRTAFWEAQ